MTIDQAMSVINDYAQGRSKNAVVRDALTQILRDERERCAVVLDQTARAAADNNDMRVYGLMQGLANAIRALKD